MVSETFPNSYTSPHIHSWIFKTLRVIIFWVRVTHKILNVNWEKIHSIILSLTLSWFQKLSPAHTHPLTTIREFLKPDELLFSELESLVKCNHKIRVQECYGGRAMSCPWHGGVEAYGGPLSVDMQPYGCFIWLLYLLLSSVYKTYFDFSVHQILIIQHVYSIALSLVYTYTFFFKVLFI